MPKTPADGGNEYFLSEQSTDEQPICVYKLRLDPDGGPNKGQSILYDVAPFCRINLDDELDTFCASEADKASGEIGACDVPGFGRLTYCGLEGFESVTKSWSEINDRICGEKNYDRLGDALLEGGDELNDETFGSSSDSPTCDCYHPVSIFLMKYNIRDVSQNLDIPIGSEEESKRLRTLRRFMKP
ncbi:hypothetical protein EDB19DRAFT_1827113 [Suillus lakei]|nr:hypothetical protein EDB19DRAFT_1827113 [Suillus lakei]